MPPCLPLSFRDFIRERRFLKNVSERTIQWYEESFRWLARYDLTPEGIKNFVIGMREAGLKPISCNSRIRVANAYFRWAGLPLHLAKLKEEQEVLPTFDPEALRRLIQYRPRISCSSSGAKEISNAASRSPSNCGNDYRLQATERLRTRFPDVAWVETGASRRLAGCEKAVPNTRLRTSQKVASRVPTHDGCSDTHLDPTFLKCPNGWRFENGAVFFSGQLFSSGARMPLFTRFAMIAAIANLMWGQNIPVAARLDEIVRANQEHRRFMGSVLVARAGKVILEKGYGMANLELDVPNSADTKFRIGSITKQFTSTAILQLQEQGKLTTSGAACRYIDNCPEQWKDITIHQLLTHTSGIPNNTNFHVMHNPADAGAPLSPIEIVMLSRDKPLDFEPGTKYLYGNTDYVLLSAIIEKVSGQKYADYLRIHIFEPLDMKSTGNDDALTILKNRASGYELWTAGLKNARYLDVSALQGAASLYSTVQDLYRWDRALYTEKILTKQSLAKAWTPEKNDYGYGWSLQPVAGHKQMGHGGGVFGFESYMARFPDDDAFVVVLSNFEGTNPQAIVRDLAMVLFGQKVFAPGERPSAKIESRVLDRYTGKYTNGSRTLTVTNENGRLIIASSGGMRWTALPASENEFFILEADISYTFIAGKDGQTEELLLKDGSRVVTFKRQ